MLFKFAKGTRFWRGNETFVLPANITLECEKLDTMDALAETLAADPVAYALNKDRLTHKEDGKTVKYGLGGRREEV